MELRFSGTLTVFFKAVDRAKQIFDVWFWLWPIRKKSFLKIYSLFVKPQKNTQRNSNSLFLKITEIPLQDIENRLYCTFYDISTLYIRPVFFLLHGNFKSTKFTITYIWDVDKIVYTIHSKCPYWALTAPKVLLNFVPIQ